MVASGARGGERTSGFALTEVVLALCLMALIATLALPGLPRAGAAASLRATAFQIAALLRDTRTKAATDGRSETVVLASGERRLHTNGGLSVELPAGVQIAVYGAPSGSIGFTADGRSTGGTLVLEGAVSRLVVFVSADTGAIRVGPP